MNKPFEFKTGDIVSFGGLRGVVVSDDFLGEYPVLFQSDANRHHCYEFTSDGRLDIDHTEPLLKLIKRPKKMVKKKGWVAIGNQVQDRRYYCCTPVYLSKDSVSDIYKSSYTIQEIEFEVESEE